MKDFLMRLTSRKFLLALGGVITAIANEEWNAAVAILVAYLAAEGASDTVQRLRAE